LVPIPLIPAQAGIQAFRKNWMPLARARAAKK
jgi:hypothetical protein